MANYRILPYDRKWGLWSTLWPENRRPTYDHQGTASLWPLEQQQAAMYDQGYDQQRLYADNSCSHHIIYYFYYIIIVLHRFTILTIPLMSHEYLRPPYVLCISVPSYYYSLFLSTKNVCIRPLLSSTSSIIFVHLFTFISTLLSLKSIARNNPIKSNSAALHFCCPQSAVCRLWSISVEIILVSI